MFNISALGRVWTNGNRVSSDGQTAEVPLQGLPEGATELFGEMTRVDGLTRLGGTFSCEPFQPGRKVTTDCFDQVVLYNSIQSVQDYLNGLGIDTRAILSSKHGKRPHPVRAHANATGDLNAFYSPQSDDLTFGTAGDYRKGQDKWHLASDNDVTTHEAGHMLLDHINSLLGSSWRGEGGAIHEGFADALAALFYDDPEMSEDFAPALGRPESKEDGLRNVNNNLTLDNSGDEEHDKGRVYAGFFWSIKKGLSDPNGPFKLSSREAADLTVKLLFNHAANYRTATPTPKDFVQAVLLGADALAASGQLRVNPEAFKELITMEADKRKMFTHKGAPEEEPDIEYLRSMGEVGRKFGPAVTFSSDGTTPFFGGYQEVYQQNYASKSFGSVRVIGSQILVNKDELGRTVFISARDARQIRPGEIDETIRVDLRGATTIAIANAQKEMLKARGEMNNLRFEGSQKDFIAQIAERQMNLKIAETALANLTTRRGFNDRPELVVLPGSNDLHYEIKVGLGTYYVNAKTGATQFKKDVFVN